MSILWPHLVGTEPDDLPARLVLVRHGETDWNRRGIAQGQADVPLNATGREQARAVAERLADRGLDALYSSDLARAHETAAVIAAACDLEHRTEPDLREIDVGEWSGLTPAQIREGYPDVMDALARGEDPPRGGGETLAELRERAVRAARRIAARHAGESVTFVAHGGILKVLVGHLMRMGNEHMVRLSLRGNTGVSLFERQDGYLRLILLNDTSHL